MESLAADLWPWLHQKRLEFAGKHANKLDSERSREAEFRCLWSLHIGGDRAVEPVTQRARAALVATIVSTGYPCVEQGVTAEVLNRPLHPHRGITQAVYCA